MSADFPEVEIIKAHPKRKMATCRGNYLLRFRTASEELRCISG